MQQYYSFSVLYYSSWIGFLIWHKNGKEREKSTYRENIKTDLIRCENWMVFFSRCYKKNIIASIFCQLFCEQCAHMPFSQNALSCKYAFIVSQVKCVFWQKVQVHPTVTVILFTFRSFSRSHYRDFIWYCNHFNSLQRQP